MKHGVHAKATPARRAPRAEEDAFLSLQKTADALMRPVASVLTPAGVSTTQYNVLRILRGSPEGLPCGEIADRMITRDPDITRLLDRLESREWIERWRKSKDRRMVLARITRRGLDLLAGLDAPIGELHRKTFRSLGSERVKTLVAILERLREAAG